MTIYFISSNSFKIKEVQEILSSASINVSGYSLKINEIQSESMRDIVIDKAIKAYKVLRRPLIVEQTGLHISDFGNLPGGLTQIFWDALQADKFCQYFSDKGIVSAETVVAYCDGKKVYTFSGEIEGSIVSIPRGDRSFQWDCVFQPSGYLQTFAELGEEKNNISMRRKALEKLRTFLEEQQLCIKR